MIRALLFVWLAPIVGFWAWFLLASNDVFFTREFLDLVFAIYAQVLGIPAAEVPHLFARAFLLDGVLVGVVVLFRRRRALAAVLRRRVRPSVA